MTERPIHTFIVLAYKESPYLENSILSCLHQEYPIEVIIGTSTDNEYIRSLAAKYGLDVVVNPVKNGGNIGDFDFAWSHGNNKLVTIAHQDDQYDPSFSRRAVEMYREHPDSMIIFTDYYEIRENERVYSNKVLKTKRALLLPMKAAGSTSSSLIRKSALCFGNAICCPAVTFVPENIPFDRIFRQNEFLGEGDWYGWYKLSNVPGRSFTYIPEALMGHRVHEDSHTSREIKDHTRTEQEYRMLKKFWPAPIAKGIALLYRGAQDSNTINKKTGE